MNPDLAGIVLVDRYGLERRLARGGMADVYRGTDLRLGRPVAVKIPHPYLADDPAFVERLRREAQAIAALAHPNVVAVYDQGEADGRSFLVMELVEGESLDTLLSRQCPLPTARAVAIVLDVLAALEHAHARGIVHRDVKPQNVLLMSEGRAKLADFGIAQAAAAVTLAVPGEVLGSIHYLAPERLSGQPATPAADLYSVGVALYQMLVGELPFQGDSTVAVAAQHQQRDPEPPSKRRADLPLWVDRVVMRALAKDPSKRYPSALAMRDDLSRRLMAHNSSTVTIPVESPGGPLSRSQFKAPLAGGERIFSRTILYAAAAAMVVLLALLALLLNHALSPWSIGATTAPERNTPTRQADVAGYAVGAPTSAASVAAPPTATAAPAPATPTPMPPTATSVPSVLQRLAKLKALVQAGTLRGGAGKEEREILKKLDEIEKKIAKGEKKEAGNLIRELIKQVQEKASKREIDRNLSEQLVVRLTELAVQIQ